MAGADSYRLNTAGSVAGADDGSDDKREKGVDSTIYLYQTSSTQQSTMMLCGDVICDFL